MNMPVVEIAIGLALVYLLMAILCSSAMEMIAGFFDLRGEMLWKGVESMLGGQGAGGLKARLSALGGALRGNVVSGTPSPSAPAAGLQVLTLSNSLIDHPLIDSMRNGERAPSYLTAERFANALLDTLGKTYQGGRQLQADFSSTVHALPGGPLKSNLELILKETGGDAAKVKERIQIWYDEVMGRVGGWYKRQTQWLLLALGLAAAAVLNVDSIDLARRMWKDPMLRSVAVKSAEAYVPKADGAAKSGTPKERAAKAVEELEALGASKLPIGWPTPWLGNWGAIGIDERAIGLLGSLLGWFITALAVSLGAPYWYELLLKMLPFARNSGVRPPTAEDKAREAAVDKPRNSAPVQGAVTQPPAKAQPAPPMPFQNALNAYEASLTQDDVHDIQQELGLAGEAVTGNLDQRTREAISRAQTARGLTANGELNSALVGELLRKRRTQ
jgi:hypothetical protein